MPEEDDDALGEMLGDRLQGANRDAEDEEPDDEESASSDAVAESGSSDDAREAASRSDNDSTQITQSTDTTSTTDEEETDPKSEGGTVRSRSPFPLYVSQDLKETVQNRFEKFNAQRTLNDEAQVEKHKHFMEGLLQAGLDHPELEEYVLEEFEDT